MWRLMTTSSYHKTREDPKRNKQYKWQNLDFKRAHCNLFRQPIGRIPLEASLKGNGTQERWLLFYNNLLKAKEWSVLKSRKSSAIAEGWLGQVRNSWLNLKTQKKKYREGESGDRLHTGNKNIVQACRDRISQSSADVQTNREYEGQQKDTYIQQIRSSKTMTEESVGLLFSGLGTHSEKAKALETKDSRASNVPKPSSRVRWSKRRSN